jgi:hypothetical protein
MNSKLRYTLGMSLSLKNLILLGIFMLPGVVSAQMFTPLNSVITPATSTPVTLGTVDLVVEAETYKPSFYRGRAEPTMGNQVRLVAVPLGRSPTEFTYQWSVDGRALPSTGPIATFSEMFKKRPRVSVSLIDNNGTLFARADEVVEFSSPEVIFYEENVLRGHGSRAIRDSHTLIGEEGVIRAEPYFVGLGTSPDSYRSTWKIDGITVDSGGDWRELLLQRPESPLPNYRVEFRANNQNNLAEGVAGSFSLNFGI